MRPPFKGSVWLGVTISTPFNLYTEAPARLLSRLVNAVGKRLQFSTSCDIFPAPLKHS